MEISIIFIVDGLQVESAARNQISLLVLVAGRYAVGFRLGFMLFDKHNREQHLISTDSDYRWSNGGCQHHGSSFSHISLPRGAFSSTGLFSERYTIQHTDIRVGSVAVEDQTFFLFSFFFSFFGSWP